MNVPEMHKDVVADQRMTPGGTAGTVSRTVRRYAGAFAIVGMAVAIILLAYDHFALVGPNGYSTATDIDAMLIVALCPPSIALMGFERVHGVQLLLGLSLIVLINGALYGVGGWVVGGIVWASRRISNARGAN